MKKFMDKDFLLNTEVSKKLYHEYAKELPIIDYHCHINPKEIAENMKYENITQVWLYGDHYKWRAIRANGVEEKYVTGDASDYDKFLKWAECMPKLIGNPLYHWTHLELKRYFGYEGVLNKDTALEVWNTCNKKIKNMSVKSIIINSKVKVICTTDDPIDDLKYHKIIKNDKDFDVLVLPTFRPDKAVNINKDDFNDYIKKLEKASKIKIKDFKSLTNALENRLRYFKENGCMISDHGLDYVVFEEASLEELDIILNKKTNGSELSIKEIEKYKSACLVFLGEEYNKKDIVMQLHYGVLRDNNTNKYKALGPDTGYDCISTRDSAKGLANLLDAMEKIDALPKSIIYSLNPNDNMMIGSIIACFQGEGEKNKIQHGSAWWFNDTKEGMIKQIKDLASISVLGNFVGMLTDSRSFLSYTRHEYFRRVLCNIIGTWVENGEYPYDEENLKKLIEDISYNNSKEYFGFEI